MLPADKQTQGYFLIYEAMYTSVLLARDRWLAPNGVVLPDQATMFVAALEGVPGLDFWDDVYGVCVCAFASALAFCFAC